MVLDTGISITSENQNSFRKITSRDKTALDIPLEGGFPVTLWLVCRYLDARSIPIFSL